MKKLFCLTIVPIFFIIIVNLVGAAREITLGGEFNTSLNAIYTEQTGFTLMPEASLDLELILPSWKNNEFRCAGYLLTSIPESKIEFFWKKLYWKHKFEKLHLTVGRQPVFWSFGSLLNPVDYTLGAAALEQEYSFKYQDALEIYYPLNWNTSFTMVVSHPGQSTHWKAGLRGRTLIKGFDITANYIQEQIGKEERDDYRWGITAKGDLGSVGVYGALGYYSREKAYSLLAGLDYSYSFPAGNQLFLQAECLYIPSGILPGIIGSLMFVSAEEQQNNITLLVGNTTYKINEFSNIGLSTLYNYSNGSVVMLPFYNDQLSTNCTIQIQGGIETKSTFKSGVSNTNAVLNHPVNLFLKIGLNHTF